ncbi:MAG TPA: MerR family transcriptional regulator, partial [Acidimicrobiales bacterium]|nr:MerR family transcriptional regulator [Acidimicrobiales bacterium]
MAADRAYLSIGEVLSLLKDEFADITISKIRFLESQGLLDPERTPSGYRKFYDSDVDRLRWILRQQREHFLPLKVIKGRLGTEETEFEEPRPEGAEEPQAAEPQAAAPRPPVGPGPVPAAAPLSTPAPQPEPRRPVLPPLPTSATGMSSGASLTLDELSGASGLSRAQVRELEEYGLLAGHGTGGSTYYDEEAVVVASLAAGFLRFGVEARHLRAYKSA